MTKAGFRNCCKGTYYGTAFIVVIIVILVTDSYAHHNFYRYIQYSGSLITGHPKPENLDIRMKTAILKGPLSESGYQISRACPV